MKMIGFFLVALSFICCGPSLSAWYSPCSWCDLESEYEFVAGYRLDELSASSKLFSTRTHPLINEHIKVNNINVFEIGGRVRWVAYKHWLVKGFVTGGVTNHGNYKQSRLDESPENFSYPIDLDVYKGNSRDASAAFGYIFTPYCGFQITPLVGLSYDFLRVTMEDSKTDSLCEARRYDKLTYKSKWIGPWLGLDTRYQYGSFQVNAGYEYHWSRWQGNVDTPKRRSNKKFVNEILRTNDAFGNVGYLSAGWNITPCFYAGLELKAQCWKAHQGRECRKKKVHRSKGPIPRFSDFSEQDILIGRRSNHFNSSSSSGSFFSSDSSIIDPALIFPDEDIYFQPDNNPQHHRDTFEETLVVGKLKSASWESFSVTLVLRNNF